MCTFIICFFLSYECSADLYNRLKNLAGLILSLLLICAAFDSPAQSVSNKGTEFWTAYMDHQLGASINGGLDSLSLMSLYITSDVNTTGIVSIANDSFQPISFNVIANQITIVTIPPSAFLGNYNGTVKKGIHILAKNQVAIYAHIYAPSVSAAAVLLPVPTFGNSYTSINYQQRIDQQLSVAAYSSFAVIATDDNTKLQINATNDLLDGHKAGAPFSVILNKGDVYQGLSQFDLTGSQISTVNAATGACSKAAFFSGSSRVQVSCDIYLQTSDNIFQQGLPTASWGKNFITTPLAARNFDVFRIILINFASGIDPKVKVNGITVPYTSFGGGYYQFSSQQPNIITSEQPVQVVQYAVSENNTIGCLGESGDVGDPEMIFLNPLEQTIDHATIYSAGNFNILKSFINVTIPTVAVPTFMLDGRQYVAFKPITGNPLYSYAQIAVSSGPQNTHSGTSSAGAHTISASSGFNAIAYGFGQPAESYGYNVGSNAANVTKNILFANPANDTITQTNGCIGVTYNLELTLPYATSNIVWNFKNGTTYTDASPKPVLVATKGNQTLYHYLYQKPVTYNAPSNDTVTATVFNPVAGECGNYETVEFDYSIAAAPTAAFNTADACLGDSTVFNDLSHLNGSYIKAWAWDFGDNTMSVLQNPKHLYAAPGSYTVKLMVTNENGCSSVSSAIVNSSTKPTVLFSVSSPPCAGQAVTITDASTYPEGRITQWIWSYGDGKIDTLDNGSPINHTYLTAGTDTIKLTVTGDRGCQVSTFKILTINPAAVVNFTLPAVCQSDSAAQFFDKTTIADSSQQRLTYLWNFGDENATGNANISALKNPAHKYMRTGNYNVSLTVTTRQGCTYTKKQLLTVNGDSPVAGFSVENSADLCSSDSVIFDDKSAVNPGNVTKWVWYFDYNNHPADSVVFTPVNYPEGGKFKHSYGTFNSPVTQSYQVRLEVYSGITCVSQPFVQPITVNANPVVTLTVPSGLCTGGSSAQIIENKNGFTGTGSFSGTGVSPAGLFDPAVSGNGTFIISYKFVAQNGCEYDTTRRIVVSAPPSISLPADVQVLEGGQVTVPARATGDSLTYQWSPAAGLSNANILNPVASPAVNTLYTLTVTSDGGCSAAAQVLISVLKYPVIPNAFTPNGDGINDYWDIKYLSSYPGNTVNIFDRYGRKVYTSNGYGTPWDGTYNGTALPTGVYYYIIDPKNGRKPIAGNVTIIR